MIKLVGCAIVALDRNDPHRVLLGKRTKEEGKDLWVLPGGKVDDNESTTECVKREAFEEVGLTLTAPVSCYHNWLPDQGGMLMLYFTEAVNPLAVELRAVHEFSELKWFDVHELPELMWASDVRAIRATYQMLGLTVSV